MGFCVRIAFGEDLMIDLAPCVFRLPLVVVSLFLGGSGCLAWCSWRHRLPWSHVVPVDLVSGCLGRLCVSVRFGGNLCTARFEMSQPAIVFMGLEFYFICAFISMISFPFLLIIVLCRTCIVLVQHRLRCIYRPDSVRHHVVCVPCNVSPLVEARVAFGIAVVSCPQSSGQRPWLYARDCRVYVCGWIYFFVRFDVEFHRFLAIINHHAHAL